MKTHEAIIKGNVRTYIKYTMSVNQELWNNASTDTETDTYNHINSILMKYVKHKISLGTVFLLHYYCNSMNDWYKAIVQTQLPGSG